MLPLIAAEGRDSFLILQYSTGFGGLQMFNNAAGSVELGVTNLLTLMDDVSTLSAASRSLAKDLDVDVNGFRDCPVPAAQQYLEQARAQIGSYDTQVQSLAGTVDSTVNQISSLDISSRTNKYALLALSALAVPVLLILMVATFGLICEGSSAAWLVLGFAYPLTILVLGCAAATELGASLAMSDVCIDPQAVILHWAPELGKSAAPVVSYYVTCKGTNPLQSYVSQAQNELVQLKDELDLWTAVCDPHRTDPMVSDARTNVAYALSNATKAASLVKCERLHSILSDFVDDAACASGITGIFVLGVLQGTFTSDIASEAPSSVAAAHPSTRAWVLNQKRRD